MAQVSTDELDRVDQAFSGNRLLSTFDAEARKLIEPFGTIVELNIGDSVLRHGRQVGCSTFPFGPTMISMAVELSGGRSVEVASVGRDGAVGGIISCGHAPAFTDAMVLAPGPALEVPMQALEDAKRRSAFVGNLFCRFSDYLLAQVMQNVACNAFHSIPQRAARWLLTIQDRAGERIELTQEAFAALLGVQRTTLNAVIRDFSSDSLIATQRGAIRVIDRAGLKRQSCECYQVLKDHFADVIGKDGTGAG